MTGKERMINMLQREPIDRIPVYEHFWGDTRKIWSEKGWVDAEVNFDDHFEFDMSKANPFRVIANIDFEPEIVEETEETVLRRDGNGALLRWHKLHASTPEHIDFLVKDRAGWEEHIKPLLVPEERRINFEAYREAKDHARSMNRFFCAAGAHAFELMKNVAGHEHMLVGMALDPDWVRDMVMTYADLYIGMQEILFEREGYPDGIWYFEDMGYKLTPFMSADMYNDIMLPGHKKTIDFAHSHGLPVIMHSCGFVEPLLPGMIAAGIDCLQVIEVKAGMDLLRIHRNYGERLSLMGGIDVRSLYSNDTEIIDAELESKIPIVKQGYGYALHSDHSIPNTVDYDSYKYFIERGKELGRY